MQVSKAQKDNKKEFQLKMAWKDMITKNAKEDKTLNRHDRQN